MNLQELKRRLTEELKRDKKRAGVLAVLLVVCLLLLVRWAAKSSGPAQAQAATGKSLAAKRKAGSPVVAAGLARPRSSVKVSRDGLMRDLFKPNEDIFPPPLKLTVQVTPLRKDEDADARERERRQFVLGQAQGLLLEATLVSDRATARINGRTLTVGDTIDGFQVMEITTRSCTVSKHDVAVVLELKMQGLPSQ